MTVRVASTTNSQELHRTRNWRLVELRRHRGLTQAQVAANMGVSAARVSQIENGAGATREVLARYIEAIGGELRLSVEMDGERFSLD